MNLFCDVLIDLPFRDLCHLWCRQLQVTNLVGKENPPSANSIGKQRIYHIRRCCIGNLLLTFTLRYYESMIGRWEQSWKYCSVAHMFWRTSSYMDILGYIWINLDILWYTCTYFDIPGYAWIYLDICTCIYLDKLGYTCIYIWGYLETTVGRKRKTFTVEMISCCYQPILGKN